jgi:DNA-binding NarL/FixJ family response regulator
VTAAVKTRILIPDDHAIVRQGVRRILDAEPDLEVVGDAACADWLSELRPLGTHPTVMLAGRGIGLRPLDG